MGAVSVDVDGVRIGLGKIVDTGVIGRPGKIPAADDFGGGKAAGFNQVLVIGFEFGGIARTAEIGMQVVDTRIDDRNGHVAGIAEAGPDLRRTNPGHARCVVDVVLHQARDIQHTFGSAQPLNLLGCGQYLDAVEGDVEAPELARDHWRNRATHLRLLTLNAQRVGALCGACGRAARAARLRHVHLRHRRQFKTHDVAIGVGGGSRQRNHAQQCEQKTTNTGTKHDKSP